MPTRRMTEKLLDQKIAKLDGELKHLKKMKLVLVQQRLEALQSELASLKGDSGPARRGRPAKGQDSSDDAAATAAPKRRKKGPGSRGKRLSEADVVARLTKVVKSAGSAGISGREAAGAAGVFYLRALKVLRKNFAVKGSGKWTRFSMK